jgi:hypothetical protein
MLCIGEEVCNSPSGVGCKECNGVGCEEGIVGSAHIGCCPLRWVGDCEVDLPTTGHGACRLQGAPISSCGVGSCSAHIASDTAENQSLVMHIKLSLSSWHRVEPATGNVSSAQIPTMTATAFPARSVYPLGSATCTEQRGCCGSRSCIPTAGGFVAMFSQHGVSDEAPETASMLCPNSSLNFLRHRCFSPDMTPSC